VKFSKFIERLRDNFSTLFLDALRVQLSLTGVMSVEDFELIRSRIRFKYQSDSHYYEMKNIELMKERLTVAAAMDPYVGRYFSNSYIRREIFGMSEETESRNFGEIENELKTGEIQLAPPEGEEEGK
jgi:hypothetical protein